MHVPLQHHARRAWCDRRLKTKSAAPAADQQPKKAVKRVKVSPKYQSEDGLQTWTGRGLKPKWLKAELDAGRKLEDFLIKTE